MELEEDGERRVCLGRSGSGWVGKGYGDECVDRRKYWDHKVKEVKEFRHLVLPMI